MKYHSVVRLQLILACAICWQSTPAALADSTVAHSKFTGVYLSQKAGPSINLSLGADGSATVTEDTGNGEITLFGRWVDSGGQVGVTLDAEQGNPVEPPPMKKGFKVKQLYWLTTGP